MIVVLGIPYDAASSFMKGAKSGPGAIREAFQSESSNTFSEDETDIGNSEEIQFVEDLVFTDSVDPRTLIAEAVSKHLEGSKRVLSLGGDHSVTYPILKAFFSKYGPLNLLQLDAHPDLYDNFEGNRYSHACPFARAHEDGLLKRHVQVGIRTMNTHQREQAERFGVEVIAMKDWEDSVPAVEFEGPTYLSLDLDVLDPAFAPGISHYEPGGASVRQVITLIQNCPFDLVGADVVELNPDRDHQSLTAMVAAKMMKELLARMLV